MICKNCEAIVIFDAEPIKPEVDAASAEVVEFDRTCPNCGKQVATPRFIRFKLKTRTPKYNPEYRCPECNGAMRFEWSTHILDGVVPVWLCENGHRPSGPRKTWHQRLHLQNIQVKKKHEVAEAQ